MLDADTARLFKVLRSGNYPQKLEALIERKKDIETKYQICPVCKNVGKPVIRLSNGREAKFMYHYSSKDGKYYCSIEHVDKRMERKSRTVSCPKCKKAGLLSSRKEVHSAYEDGNKARIYGISRLVVMHGRKPCFINKEHLKELRKRYGIKNTKITTAHGVITYSNDRRIGKGVKNKLNYELSDIVNRLGLSLTGKERIMHIIRTLEGQLEAKKEGKKIRFGVEKAIEKFRKLLAVEEEKERIKVTAMEESQESEEPLLKDEWFVEHQEKLGITSKHKTI